ncbi:MAG: ATP-binding cassette domain-containing protein, partial [Spirochaeta sp.]|nr:ATP-binding cassette domain-containing protein [Spirochaeta sp.]
MSAWLEASFHYKIDQFNLQVDFTMEREIGVLFGPSGAGKSLTLRLLAGLQSPVRGSMVLGNRKLLAIPGGRNLRPKERRIALVFQHLALFPHLTALENV